MLYRRSVVLLLVATLVLPLPRSAKACIWDSDTLAAELKGLPDLVSIIIGRFERQPPKYYEMRLERVSTLLEEDPQNLEAYDDAGAACDRLGRGDEAIAWMEKKKLVLDEMDPSDPTVKDHRYRYLANVGTFWVHRWFHNGADRTRLDEVRTGRKFIAEAIELNPEAHFGREKYQLKAMNLILSDYDQSDSETGDAARPIPSILDPEGELQEFSYMTEDNDALAKLGMADAVQGLTGLIALGNAWESVDVYHALSLALQAEGRSQPAYLAGLRMRELLESGRKSVVSDRFGPDQLRQEMLQPLYHPLSEETKQTLKQYYDGARKSADQWNESRTAYMQRQFAEGKHPDTHQDFWKDWVDAPQLPPQPNVSGHQNPAPRSMPPILLGLVMIAGIGLTIGLCLLLGFIFVLPRRSHHYDQKA